MIDHSAAYDAHRTGDTGITGQPVAEGALVDKEPVPGEFAVGETGQVDRLA
ncbi:MAG TPA: hypothetical protein VJN70_09090 [Gemmatimonadaceae bacterium]|nr:hypothetical protein [Gemmatimonadaceae bacterium]